MIGSVVSFFTPYFLEGFHSSELPFVDSKSCCGPILEFHGQLGSWWVPQDLYSRPLCFCSYIGVAATNQQASFCFQVVFFKKGYVCFLMTILSFFDYLFFILFSILDNFFYFIFIFI
eukprot:Trichotokara_eunicae@DN976_c0_g1_i1.p2